MLRLLTENFRRSNTCNICVISWWNNLNRKIELASGKGSIHSNPVIVFQEITIESVSMDVEISVPNSGRISLPKCDHETSIASKINPNRNPPILNPPPTVLIHQQNLNSNYNMVYFPFLSGTTFKVSITVLRFIHDLLVG